jgi:hypothetical protein
MPKDKYVKAIRPHLYKHGLLTSGNLIFELYDGATLLKTSTMTYLQLNSFMDSYSHGHLTWNTDLRLGGRRSGESSHEYTLALTWTGADGAISWIMDYEGQHIQSYGDGQGNDAYMPRDIEVLTWD